MGKSNMYNVEQQKPNSNQYSENIIALFFSKVKYFYYQESKFLDYMDYTSNLDYELADI